MKKRTITLLATATFTAAMVLSGCSASTARRAAKLIDAVSDQTQVADNVISEAPTATPEPTPATTQLKLGDKAQVGDWSFKVKKVSTKKVFKISDYTGYKPADGNTFVCLTMSVENKGSEEAKFLPMVGFENTMLTAVLYYQDQYEYKPSDLTSYDKCLTNESIKPLNKKSGVVVFEVPKKVAKDLKQATVKIGTVDENVVYPLIK
ncbi:MAG: DUF4352 domain-containing protein [Lachnospiraceae bacterium]|nr:DUF4352 domain-containing protein [Lachnospiraceae bacterium]